MLELPGGKQGDICHLWGLVFSTLTGHGRRLFCTRQRVATEVLLTTKTLKGLCPQLKAD